MAVTTPTPPYTPINECYVCSGIGFDATYQNVRLFSTANSRLSYFQSKSIGHYSNITPIVLSDGYIRIPALADNFYNADYVLFRNSDFDSGRWFYAFITSVEFKNLGTCNIHFELDVMQTWLDSTILTPCFIERMHWPTDAIGDNLVSDNLELGDYIINHSTQTDMFDNYSIIVACTTNENGAPSSGGYYGGIYSGLNLLQFTSATAVNDFLVSMVDSNKSSAIVSIFMMPTAFFSAKSTSNSSSPVTQYFTYSAPNRNTLNGYTPTNKKLLTYPYKLLTVSNLSGNSAEYHYEYFGANNIFEIVGDCSPNPTIKLSPLGYNGFNTGVNAFDYGLTLNGFPQCSWSTDAYLAWLAQSGSVSALGMTFTGADISFAQQGVGAVGNLLSGNIGGTINSVLGIAQSVAKVNATKSLPPQANGQTANGAMVAFRAKDFVFTDLSIRREFAEIIDGYWTKYGYPCKELRSISLRTRQSYNFIKTQGCNTSGTAPQWARAQIQNIFDSGVTFWHTDDIGNYYLNNSPL